jgi:predicted secreted protein
MLRTVVLASMCWLTFGASAQISQQPFINVISFEASATSEVPTDTLTITLFTEEQGPDPTELAARVNTRIEQALATAKNDPAVEAHSGNYQTNPLYDRANQITGWRIRAELVLESRDFKRVAALAGRLQPALKLAGMTFSLSPAAREKAESALLTEALDKYQKKAQVIARALGFPGYTLSQVSVRSDGQVVHPVAFRQMAVSQMAEAAPAVPAEGGKNTVTMIVAGSVVLGPGK